MARQTTSHGNAERGFCEVLQGFSGTAPKKRKMSAWRQNQAFIALHPKKSRCHKETEMSPYGVVQNYKKNKEKNQ